MSFSSILGLDSRRDFVECMWVLSQTESVKLRVGSFLGIEYEPMIARESPTLAQNILFFMKRTMTAVVPLNVSIMSFWSIFVSR